jgi:hypothetical protein
MRSTSRVPPANKYNWLGNYNDIVGLDERLRSYTGKPKSLIASFNYWYNSRPEYSKKKITFNKRHHIKRADELRKRILNSDNYPNNYIRVKDRSGMLARIELFNYWLSSN